MLVRIYIRALWIFSFSQAVGSDVRRNMQDLEHESKQQLNHVGNVSKFYNGHKMKSTITFLSRHPQHNMSSRKIAQKSKSLKPVWNDTQFSKTYRKFNLTIDTAFKIVIHYRKTRSTDEPCHMFGTCSFIAKLPTNKRYCHCDDECIKYKDCCPEVQNNNITVTDENNDLTDPREMKPMHLYQCASNGTSKERFKAFVIVSCHPSYAGSKLEILCNKLDNVGYGGWVADKDGLVYRNQFCAKCNNLTSFMFFPVIIRNIETLEISDQLNKTQQIKLDLSNTNKVIVQYVTPPGIEPRSCVQEVSVKSESERCLNYGANPVETKGGIYRNVYCKPETFKYWACLGQSLDVDQMYSLYPMTVMFSFSQTGSDSDCIQKRDDFCYGREMYTNYEVQASYTAMVSGEDSVNSVNLEIFVVLFCLSLQKENISVFDIESSSFQNDENSLLIIDVRVRLLQTLLIDDVLRYKTLIQNGTRIIVIKNSHDNKLENVLQFQTMSQIASTNSPSNGWRNLIIWNENSQITDFVELLTNVTIVDNLQNSTPLCTNMVIDISMQTDKDYLVESTRCLIVTEEQSSSVITLAKVIITYTGFGVSIVSLVCFLTINRRMEHHLTLAGANLENVCVSLLISIVLFVVGIGLNDHPIVCKVMAIALHYSWLTVFVFKTIAVIGIIRNVQNFQISNMKTPNQIKTKILRSRVLGLCVPLLLVVPLIVMSEILRYPNYRYGSQGVCFPTDYPSNLIFVSGPIILSIAINSACLLLTVKYIRRVKSQTVQLTSTTSFNETFVYLRFCLFAGTPWIIGILSAFVKSDVLDFVFIVLCSLQGLFIVISNITSKKMRRRLSSVTSDGKAQTVPVNEAKF